MCCGSDVLMLLPFHHLSQGTRIVGVLARKSYRSFKGLHLHIVQMYH
jgi:hypothetical protein